MTTRANEKRCGLDIGGTQIKVVLLDSSNQIVEECSTPSQAHLGPKDVRKSVLTLLGELQGKGHQFETVGIGCAGSVNSELGIVRNSPNFTDWKDINLKNWIEEQIPVRVKVDNDANCAVLAEWHLGKGRGFKNVVLLTLGTGIGGGLILNGKLFRGSTGTAGELGHFSINSAGIPCPCGNRGCFERYCSASALKGKLPQYSAKEVFELINSVPVCKNAVIEFLSHLKVGLVSLANVFDPDVILLGGAVSLGLQPFIGEIRDWVKRSAFPAVGERVQIDFTLFSNNSGAIGAALLHELE